MVVVIIFDTKYPVTAWVGEPELSNGNLMNASYTVDRPESMHTLS